MKKKQRQARKKDRREKDNTFSEDIWPLIKELHDYMRENMCRLSFDKEHMRQLLGVSSTKDILRRVDMINAEYGKQLIAPSGNVFYVLSGYAVQRNLRFTE